jgi:hypothetical protein
VRLWLVTSCALLVVLFVPSRALAFERQWHAGIDAGAASLFGDPSAAGYGGGVHAVYGVSDAFNALIDVDFTHHPSVSTNIWSGGIGLAYTLDVARAVPYAGLLAAGYQLSGDLSTTAPGLQIALGLDYQIDRSWALGLELKMHTIFAQDPVGTTAYGTTFLRFEYTWGF